MPMPTQGQQIPTLNEEWQRWNRLYTNGGPDGLEGRAPNYARSIGRLVAGLLQQQPVAFAEGTDNEVLTLAALADLTDRGVKRATAESVIFLRPVQVNGDWRVSILHGGQVEATWAHEQLVEALAWTLVKPADEGGEYQMITEHYRFGGSLGVVTQLWKVSKVTGTGQWQLDELVDISDPAANLGEGEELLVGEPALHRQVREMEPRRIIPFAFDFEDGRPIPIHFTNEDLVDRLVEMHEVEDQDDALPRNIMAVSRDSLGEATQGNSRRGLTGRIRGLIEGMNLISVEADRLAQHGAEGIVQAVHMEADMITREKIKAKEDGFYEACGIAPQTFGRSVTGASDSGKAKRADNQLTLTTVAGPARRWAQALTDLAGELVRLTSSGGIAPSKLPVVQVTEGLKMSAEERATLLRDLRDADAISIRESVRQANPDWDDQRVDQEVAEIRNDSGLPTPADL